MGTFIVPCSVCKKPFLWWSGGSPAQICEDCSKPMEEKDRGEYPIESMAKELQENCHVITKYIISEIHCSNQDATNVWLFYQLADIHVRLNKLEGK